MDNEQRTKNKEQKTISCPVCGHPEVEENQCRNCETDLSVYQMLLRLSPTEETSVSETQKIPWRWVGISVVLVLVIAAATPYLLGYGRELIISQLNTQVSQRQEEITAKLSSISQQQGEISQMLNEVARQQDLISTLQPKTEGCGGFYYTVQQGDSLSQIGRQFYGSGGGMDLILNRNPQLKDRSSLLQVGEMVFIPNRNSSCP